MKGKGRVVATSNVVPILKAELSKAQHDRIGELPEGAARWSIAQGTGAGRIGRMLEFLHERAGPHRLTYAQFAAGCKYRLHWHRAGLEPGIATVDLDRTGGAPNGFAGMPITEDQVHHRQQWRRANKWIGKRAEMVLTLVGCHDCGLEQAGYKLGENNKARAIAGARQVLLGAVDRLCDEWGI